MSTLIDCIIFVNTFVITVGLFSVTIVPIFYGIPKVIYLSFIKEEIKLKAIAAYLITPAVWTIAILVASSLLLKFLPSFVARLLSGWGFRSGQISAVIFSLYRDIFTAEGRRDISEEFRKFVVSYRKIII